MLTIQGACSAANNAANVESLEVMMLLVAAGGSFFSSTILHGSETASISSISKIIVVNLHFHIVYMCT